MTEIGSCGNTRGKSRSTNTNVSNKEQKLIKSGEKTNKSGNKDDKIETQSIENLPVDDRDKMISHTCKIRGHKYLAECVFLVLC